MNKLYLFFVLFFFSSCHNNEKESELRSLIFDNDSVEFSIDKHGVNEIIISKYQNLELNKNKKFVDEIDQIVSSGFEQQLERFEDEELGFWAGYGYMFSYLFKSQEKWEDDLMLTSDKYFNTIDIEQKVADLHIEHISYIKTRWRN